MKHYFSLVKISHTVFALPFALIGFFIGVEDLQSDRFPWHILAWVIGCMFFARNAAMAFNRLIDARVDAANPRTAVREIPSGILSKSNVAIFVVVNALAFMACAYMINRLCFWLSPVALAVILGYSFAKRFTAAAHFILGLGLALAPVGAYLAVVGQFALLPIMLGLIVILWVSGFDMIYALQDEEVDRTLALHSIPARVGAVKTIKISIVLHTICAIGLLLVGAYLVDQYEALSAMTLLGILVFIAILIYQHLIVHAKDLSRINLAFFTLNGIGSIVLGLLLITDLYL